MSDLIVGRVAEFSRGSVCRRAGDGPVAVRPFVLRDIIHPEHGRDRYVLHGGDSSVGVVILAQQYAFWNGRPGRAAVYFLRRL